MKIDKELLKGSTTMLILKLLSQKDMYGYKMIKELEFQSNNIFTLKEGTLYPILHSLEKERLVESYWDDSDSIRKRKFYSITKRGLKVLVEKKNEWNTYAEGINNVFMEVRYNNA